MDWNCSLPLEKVSERVLYHQDVHSFDEYTSFDLSLLEAPQNAQRIFVIQPSSIGDVLYLTPSLTLLRSQYPNAWIGYLVEDDAESAIHGGIPDQLFVAHKNRWINSSKEEATTEINQFLSEINSASADLVINTHATARSAWYATAARGSGAPVLGIHFNQNSLPALSGNPFHYRWFTNLTQEESIKPPEGITPTLNALGDLSRRTGTGRLISGISLNIDEETRTAAHKDLELAGIDISEPYACLHTGCKWEDRRYTAEKWPEVCEGLVESWNLQLVFIGGPNDREPQDIICNKLSVPAANLSGKGNLSYSAAILEKCSVLVSADTATVHLAASVLCPTVTVSGPKWVGAYAPKSYTLYGDDLKTWRTQITPEMMITGAGVVLGQSAPPSLSDGLHESWTGDKYPTEFIRQRFPFLMRKGQDYVNTVLSYCWENIFSVVNESWKYPAARISVDEAVNWLGQPDSTTKDLIGKKIKDLKNWEKDLDTLISLAKGNASSGKTDLSKSYQAVMKGFWPEFFQPLNLHRSAIQNPNSPITDVFDLYKSSADMTRSFLDSILDS